MNKHISRFLNDEENYKTLSEGKINRDNVFSKTLEWNLSKEILLSTEIDEDSYRYLVKSIDREYSDLNVSQLTENKIVTLLDNDKLKFSSLNFSYLADSITDKYIDLIELDFDKFVEVRDEGELDLPVGAVTKLMHSSVLLPENKQKIIDDIHEKYEYDLFDEEDDLVRAIIDVCLQEVITLDFFFIEKLFEYEKKTSKKIEFLTQYAASLNEDELYSLLGGLGEPYLSIKPKGFFAYLQKSDLNFKLANALERSGYILNQNSKIRKIQLTLKRS